jgi:Flp pilus assembly protein TadG
MRRHDRIPGLRNDLRGSVAVETALIAPLLVMLCLGAFEVSMLVARQSELQGAAGQAAAIVLAAPPETPAQIARIRNVVAETARLPADRIAVGPVYRCGTDEALVAAADACADDEEVSSFLRIILTDTVQPEWTRIGLGREIRYRIVRTVQLS